MRAIPSYAEVAPGCIASVRRKHSIAQHARFRASAFGPWMCSVARRWISATLKDFFSVWMRWGNPAFLHSAWAVSASQHQYPGVAALRSNGVFREFPEWFRAMARQFSAISTVSVGAFLAFPESAWAGFAAFAAQSVFGSGEQGSMSGTPWHAPSIILRLEQGRRHPSLWGS
jgi:hypothetical protein